MGTGKVIPNGDATNTKIGRLKIMNLLFDINLDSPVTDFKVGTGTDTPGVGDTDLQTSAAVDPGPHDILAGFPVLSETTQIANIRGKLSSSQANGQSLTEIGWCDDSGKILTRQVHDAISKTLTEEIAYIGTLKVVDL